MLLSSSPILPINHHTCNKGGLPGYPSNLRLFRCPSVHPSGGHPWDESPCYEGVLGNSQRSRNIPLFGFRDPGSATATRAGRLEYGGGRKEDLRNRFISIYMNMKRIREAEWRMMYSHLPLVAVKLSHSPLMNMGMALCAPASNFLKKEL